MPKKGELFVITDGEYSDYSIRAHFRAKSDFNLKQEYRENFPKTLKMVPVMRYGEYIKDPARPFGARWLKYNIPRETGEMRKEYADTDKFLAYLIREDLVEEVDCPEFNLGYLQEENL